MRSPGPLLVPCALVLALCACVATPPPPLVAPASAEEAEVIAVVERLFEGMRAGDSALVRSVFHPSARLLTAGVREGTPVLQLEAVDEFVAAVGAPRTEVWDERIWKLEVRVDDNLAAAWMDYAFYFGGRFSHCGVNAVQLFHAPGGWQITQLTDTRRRTGCELPPAGS